MHPQNIICRAFGLNTLLLQHKIIRAIHSYCSPAAVPLPDVQTPPSRLQIMISNTCKMHSPAPVSSRHPHSMSPPLSNSLKWRQHPTRGIAPSSGMRLRSTLKSLDNILGSQDDDQPPPAQQQAPKQELTQLRVPGWAWGEVQEPRVVPLATNALYYLLLVVFVAYYVVQLSDGQEAADDLIARLANDHVAVASGDALRLYTCAFVADSIPALIFGLVGMATVASELESLLGYSTFWALLSLSIMTGSLADAALSSIPITQGPGPAVAGVAGALLAYHARNWELEQLLLQIKAGRLPQQWQQLEADYNTKKLQAQSRLAGDTSSATAADDSAGGASSTSAAAADAPPSAQKQQQREKPDKKPRRAAAAGFGSVVDDDEFVESDLDMPLLSWLGISVMLPKEGKAFVTLGGIATSVVAALREVTSTDAATDWTGLAAGFAAGLWLGWSVSPLYELQLVEANADDSNTSSSNGTSGSSRNLQSSTSSPPLRVLLPVLRDTRPAVARANAVFGYAGLLFAVLGAWLLQQGGL